MQDWNDSPAASPNEPESSFHRAAFEDLRRMARRFMSRERPDHTLQPTALVSEAYLRLLQQHNLDMSDRGKTLAAMVGIMRRVLVDHARRNRANKRFGARARVELDEGIIVSESRSQELVELNEALERLTQIAPRAAQVVDLVFFAGLTEIEAAEVLGISARTAKRDWSFAKAWLHAEMTKGHGRTSTTA